MADRELSRVPARFGAPAAASHRGARAMAGGDRQRSWRGAVEAIPRSLAPSAAHAVRTRPVRREPARVGRAGGGQAPGARAVHLAAEASRPGAGGAEVAAPQV